MLLPRGWWRRLRHAARLNHVLAGRDGEEHEGAGLVGDRGGHVGIEGEIVLTPNHEETWLSLLHPCLPFRVGVDVRSIIVEKITLNFGLAALQALPLDGDSGPEHVVVRAEDGRAWVWAAVTGSDNLSGRIVRMRPDGGGREVVVDTGGRPLGFDFDATGAMIVADPMVGRHGGLYVSAVAVWPPKLNC